MDRLYDIHVHRVPRHVLMSPLLGAQLQRHADIVAALYRARVAKKTGKLAASVTAQVVVGGHQHDRLIGKVVVGGADWVDYAVLHEFGAPGNPSFEAADDLAEAVARWKMHRT